MSDRPIAYLDVELIGPPMPTPRGRTVLREDADGEVRASVHNPAAYRTWKKDTADKLEALAAFRAFDGEVSVTIDVSADRLDVRVAALDPDDKRRQPTGLRGDLDNYVKAVLDALQTSGVVPNDRNVVELAARFRP